MSQYNSKAKINDVAKKALDSKKGSIALSHDQKMLIIKKAHEAMSRSKSA